MLRIFIVSLTLLAASVLALAHDNVTHTLIERQTNSTSQACKTPCAAFTAVKQGCKVPHCGCTSQYLQAQGECLVCQTKSPQDAASVQFLLDSEINQCHESGIPIQFRLELPPAAQAIVDEFDRQSASLRQQQTAFFALQVAGGHVGLVVILIFAVFSRKVRRDPTFLNFCITWIFSSIVYCILLYRGTGGNTAANSLGRVPQGRCLAQAALTNGAQVLTACSTMALVIQLWIGLRVAIHGDVSSGPSRRTWVTISLLVLPYVLFVAFAIPSVFVGRNNFTIAGSSVPRVLPANFYCSIVGLESFLQAIYGVTLGLLIITTVFDAHIIFILYRHWWAFRNVQTKSAVSLSILLRVLIFSIYRVVVAVAYGTVLNRPPQITQTGSGEALAISFDVPVWVDMLQATLPLIGFLVLGINGDMLAMLKFWRRNKRAVSTLQSINTTNTGTVRTVDLRDSIPMTEKSTFDADTKVAGDV